jgi:hypothetical protein
MGAQLGNLECLSTEDFEIRLKGAPELESLSLSLSLCGSSAKGTWREGSLAGDPEGYVAKALETGIPFHRGPVWGNLEEGSSIGDFEICMKGALEMECLSLTLSLKMLRGGVSGGSSFTGDPM